MRFVPLLVGLAHRAHPLAAFAAVGDAGQQVLAAHRAAGEPLGVGQVLAHRFPGVAVDDRLPRGCDAVEDLAVMHRQPGDGWPQQHLAHLTALPLVALGSLEALGIPVFGDALQGRAVEQRVAGFADRGSLFGHDGVAVVAETALHPRLSVLGALAGWLPSAAPTSARLRTWRRCPSCGRTCARSGWTGQRRRRRWPARHRGARRGR